MLIILFFFVYIKYNIFIMMSEKQKKVKNIFWSLVYLALATVIIVSAASMFNNFYYESVYVSGSSMSPTFDGNTGTRLGSDYGIIDKDSGAKRNVKRFQIVTTYYPSDYQNYGTEDQKLLDTATYKIKRVLVKPGETFKVEDNKIFIKGKEGYGDPLDIPFIRHGIEDESKEEAHRNWPETTLNNSQYFLAGDNWVHSSDSFSIGPIDYQLLVGVVVKMQGKCTVVDGKVVEKEPYADRYFLGVNY